MGIYYPVIMLILPKEAVRAWGMKYIPWMDKDALEELRSHLMNACGASQMLASKVMKHRSLYLLLTLPQLCLEKKKVSCYEEKRRNMQIQKKLYSKPYFVLLGI